MRAFSPDSFTRDLPAIVAETDKVSVSSLETEFDRCPSDQRSWASFEMANFDSLELSDPELDFDLISRSRRASATSRRRSSGEEKRDSLDLGLPVTGRSSHSKSPTESDSAQRKHWGDDHTETKQEEILRPESLVASVAAGREWDFAFDRNSSAASATIDNLCRLNSVNSAASRASSGEASQAATRANSGAGDNSNRRSSSGVGRHERTASSCTIDEEREQELAVEQRIADAAWALAASVLNAHHTPSTAAQRRSSHSFRELPCSSMDEDGSSEASAASTHVCGASRGGAWDPARRLRRARYNTFVGQLIMQELAASVQEI